MSSCINPRPASSQTLIPIGYAASILCVLLLFQSFFAFAQPNRPATSAVAGAAHPDFSGFWEVVRPPGTRGARGPAAKLTPKAIEHEKRVAAERAEGKAVVYASRWCNFLGMPFIMGQSPPINIVQVSDELNIFSEQNSAPRHIYLDGRNHPDASTFVPSSNGHSIARWDNAELIVDTTNFSAKGHPEIPGGGYRTQTSHLVEHFKLSEDGKSLLIVSTWTDPEILLEPVTYTTNYRKMPPETFAYEDICDASDPAPFDYSGGTLSAPDADQ
jgi:hypothetical protein